jgi:hypothetical protein
MEAHTSLEYYLSFIYSNIGRCRISDTDEIASSDKPQSHCVDEQTIPAHGGISIRI